MRSIPNALNGVIIYTGSSSSSLPPESMSITSACQGGGIVERAGRNLPAFREGLGLLGGVMASCCIAWVGSTFVASLLGVARGRGGQV